MKDRSDDPYEIEREREVGVVALHLPIGPLKAQSRLMG